MMEGEERKEIVVLRNDVSFFYCVYRDCGLDLWVLEMDCGFQRGGEVER